MTLLLLSAFAPDAAAQDRTYDVTVSAARGGVVIAYRTVDDQPEICTLRTVRAEVDAGTLTPQGGVVDGGITLDTILDPLTVCAQTFGPWSGRAVLARGPDAPALRPGEYALVIDGELYGMLHVTRSGATLTGG
jgi:hypothetical protein